ncbi:MAG: redoxin domain-containing protein [Methanophagales archaeon ANME-1-THS]|nr:MAG: redoxin domain-containing protein [Methanophagales archaeon ANME-1-THS]
MREMRLRVSGTSEARADWSSGRRSAASPLSDRAPRIILLVIGMLVMSGALPLHGVQAAGSEAPPFTLTSIEGTTFNLSDYQGKVVVLDLMATWCPVCKVEMKELAQLRERYTEVVIITISVDPTETEEKLRSFKETYNADWLFALDTENILVRYNAFTLPTIVVIDPHGKITFQRAAFITAAELESEVERALSGSGEEPEEPGEPITAGLYLLALLTGLLSFFAPCAFPLLPGYISYYLGREEGGATLSGSVKAGIAAATGINGIFALIGIAVAVGGVAVKSYLSYLTPAVGVAILLLGLAMVLGKTELFDTFGRLLSSSSSKIGVRAQHSGLFLYGVGYGLAVMGCQVPVFIALVFAGLASGGALNAFLVFLSFSLGMGGMMLTVSLLAGMAKMQVLDRLKQMVPFINRVCGVILIIVGAFFLLEFI